MSTQVFVGVSTQAVEILTELHRRGVAVSLDGDDILLKPRQALDDTLRARIRQAKPAILEILRNRPSTCSPDCYEVEPGVWVHRPWARCTTIKPEAGEAQRRVSVTCWHCRGEKTCGCSACWQSGLQKCAPCRGTGQVWKWIQ